MTKFRLYATHNEGNVRDKLGKSDYSYWFVLKYFESLMPHLGETEVLADSPVRPVELDLNEEMLLAFTPPHKVPNEALQYAIPVFAWEFDTIPNESWLDDDRNNW
jgi:hypothetical protein